jgi:hypothetical protein
LAAKSGFRIVGSCCVCSQPRISTREGFAIRQELTGSPAGTSSRHVWIVQRLSPGPHEQRALFLVRDPGLVKGGKRMRHHEVVIAFSLRAALRWLRQPSARRFEPETNTGLIRSTNP